MGRVSLVRSEQIKQYDRYLFEDKSSISTKDVTVFVDHEKKEITGDMVAYGDWFDIESDDCIEYLETLNEDELLRDFQGYVRKTTESERDRNSVNNISYYLEQDIDISEATANDVFLTYENNLSGLVGYAPTYGYFSFAKNQVDSIENCTKINVDEYKELSDGHYTPMEFIAEDKEEVIVYFYNGFSEPEMIEDIEELSIESNYLGDVTDDMMDEYAERIGDKQTGNMADFQENQFVAEYGVWVNPTKKQLQEFNQSVGLDKNDFLQNFEGSNQLFTKKDAKSVYQTENEERE